VRLFAVAGSALLAGGLLLLAAAPDYALLLVAVFLMGCGGGMLDMVLSPIICALQPERARGGAQLLHSFFCIGAVATTMTATWALGLDFSWRGITRWMAIPPVAGMRRVFVDQLPRMAGEKRDTARLADLWRNRFYQFVLAAMFFAGATEIAMAQWLPAYAEKGLGLSRWAGGIALTAFRWVWPWDGSAPLQLARV